MLVILSMLYILILDVHLIALFSQNCYINYNATVSVVNCSSGLQHFYMAVPNVLLQKMSILPMLMLSVVCRKAQFWALFYLFCSLTILSMNVTLALKLNLSCLLMI